MFQFRISQTPQPVRINLDVAAPDLAPMARMVGTEVARSLTAAGLPGRSEVSVQKQGQATILRIRTRTGSAADPFGGSATLIPLMLDDQKNWGTFNEGKSRSTGRGLQSGQELETIVSRVFRTEGPRLVRTVMERAR